MQVFELLCALCLFSPKGHTLALDSLFFYTVSINTHAFFSFEQRLEFVRKTSIFADKSGAAV
jgi:hypothetical protein